MGLGIVPVAVIVSILILAAFGFSQEADADHIPADCTSTEMKNLKFSDDGENLKRDLGSVVASERRALEGARVRGRLAFTGAGERRNQAAAHVDTADALVTDVGDEQVPVRDERDAMRLA